MCHPSWGRARLAAQRLDQLVRLRRVRDRIEREYARPLDVLALARAVDLPPGQLSRQFTLAYGASPYALLMRRRRERATVPLRRGDRGLDEVRQAVGCPSPRAFDIRLAEPAGGRGGSGDEPAGD
ncbi:AraC family transcriptional regulator [Streptomyces sp. ODS05-4]|uniref:AraC family transcriptional regulator n=1 Tax=Streptomyces sp. ODS05-4 TaxID=2944939 RepID=UPI0027E4AEEA|nr:AraC family transcriptional regulator [Streptomyces sp. ODS05-4]